MPKISVLTPTIREDGLSIVKKALDRQSFQEFEWLVGSYFEPKFGNWVKDDFKDGHWTLNRIMNKMIKAAQADLIVSWQDYTFADADTLEKFYYHHRTEPKTIVTAIGNKYDKVYPVLGRLVWKDPRERDDQGSFYPCFFNDIEGNLCSVPKQAFYDVGGFNEQMDFDGFGMDFYNVMDRLNEFGGYDFKINQTIKSYSLPHERHKDWDKYNLLHNYNRGKVKLNYL